MVKTLKIAVIFAGLLSIASVGGVTYLALQPDKQVQNFLNTQGQIAAFVEAAKNQQKKNESPDSPLVKQAELFTVRIDPPPPPAPKVETPAFTAQPQQQVIRRPPPSAKFTLEGTVVSSNPEYSMAFLNTTSKGLRWYRQSEKIGYMTIEEIHEDKIVVNDGSETFEMEVPKRQRISLLKGDPNNPYSGDRVNPYKAAMEGETMMYEPATNRSFRPITDRGGRRNSSTTTAPALPDKPSKKMLQENMEFLQKIANDPESMGMTKEEAAQLGDMSGLMKELERDLKEIEKKEGSAGEK